MILRRFLQHVKEQNWVAVGLDVLVVIVGIFLGMQVTEWNERREEAEQETGYLHRLRFDLERSLDYQNTLVDYIIGLQQSVEAGYGAWRRGLNSEEDRAAFLKAVRSSATLVPEIAYMETIEDLQNTGSMRIIKDEEIRKRLVRYRNRIDSRYHLMNGNERMLLSVHSRLRNKVDLGYGEIPAKMDQDAVNADPTIGADLSTSLNSFSLLLDWLVEARGLTVELHNDLVGHLRVLEGGHGHPLLETDASEKHEEGSGT